MPRERVQHGLLFEWAEGTDPEPGELPGAGRQFFPGEAQTEGTVLREEPSLDVKWNREAGWVQLAFDAPRDWWERFMETYKNLPSEHHFAAHTNVMSREEINNMIKVLRRARDAAYGADE